MTMLAILLAGARIATTSADRSSSKQATDSSASVSMQEAPPEDAGCEAFDQATVDAKPDPGNKIDSLVDQYLNVLPESRTATGALLPPGITFMIVTVPDPIHTHLSLQFDRTLEALQQALQDEKFTYDSSWLPWKTRTSGDQSLSDETAAMRQAATRETCPGLIIFRRNMGAASLERAPCPASGKNDPLVSYECGLFAFVVSETPTAGINHAQWANALAWMKRHSSPQKFDKALRILGPTFSGSMPSLVRALTEVRSGDSSFTSALLYSGRVRGCGPWGWLNSQLNAPGTLPVRTADFEENDAILLSRFFRFLSDQGHSLTEVAILSEDETAYGGLPDSKATKCEPEYPEWDRPVHLYYPRDISAIRSAYQEQSLFSTSSPTASAKTSHTVLQPQPQSTSRSATDSIESFSGQGLALTQEAQLYGIVNSLRAHAIRFVVLRSTNSLDYLFLARFLHRAYPDAFVITMGSDMLFGREVDSTEFRGVIALTTYPLLPRGQDWTKQTSTAPQHAHRVFGSDIMEGVYLAGRFLATDYDWDKDPNCKDSSRNDPTSPCRVYIHPAKKDIPDYAPAFWEENQKGGGPSTWLAMIGREGYWPLAVLSSPYEVLVPQGLNLTAVRAPAPESSTGGVGAFGGFTLSAAWKFICFVALLLFSTHLFASYSGWKQQNFGIFIQFTPAFGNRQPFLMAIGWATVCSTLLLLFLASAPMYTWLRAFDKAWVGLMAMLAIAGCAMSVLYLGVRHVGKTKDTARNEKYRHPHAGLLIAMTLVLIAISGLGAFYIFGHPNPNGVLVAYRSVHITSGISPVVSLLLILVGIYWWFWQALSGLALLGPGKPILPWQTEAPKGLSRIGSKIAGGIEASAIPIPTCRGENAWFYFLPILLLGVQACVLQRPWSQGFDSILHSLENKAFNWTLHCLLGIGGYLMLVDCCQFVATWLGLKRLLLALNRLPLRRTFAALQGLSMYSLWNMSGASSRARLTIFSHQFESLSDLCNELDSFDSRASGTANVRAVISKTVIEGANYIDGRSKIADLALLNDDDAFKIRRVMSLCTEKIFEDILMPAWHEERRSMDLAESREAGKQREILPLSDETAVMLAEEFVCLVYVGYLQTVLARMRTMVLSMAGVFVTVAFAVAFYPYTPRPLLTLCLLLLLAVLGIAVAVVYAGLDRDSTLSHITNTTPGSLGAGFWMRILSFVGVPVLGLLVAQFPEITDFVFSWVQPGMSAMK
jgi:hypothetical protein